MDNNINSNLDNADEVSALLEIINQSESATQSFTAQEKTEVFKYAQDLLNNTNAQIENLTPEQAEPLEERFGQSFEDLSTGLYGLDQSMWGSNIQYYMGLLAQKWESIKTTVKDKLGIGDSDTPNTTDTDSTAQANQPTMQMAPVPEQPPIGGGPSPSSSYTASYVPQSPAGRNDGISNRPRGSNASRVRSSSIKQATRPVSQPGGPEYFIRTGFNKYSPAVQADVDSGQQLFMRNPNPALRMVYPYVKVDSMVKKARRATPA